MLLLLLVGRLTERPLRSGRPTVRLLLLLLLLLLFTFGRLLSRPGRALLLLLTFGRLTLLLLLTFGRDTLPLWPLLLGRPTVLPWLPLLWIGWPTPALP